MTRLFPDSGYWALGIVYFVFGFFSVFSGPFISFAGPRISMVIGSIPYFLFIGALLIGTFNGPVWLVYFMSVLIGIGASLLWGAQGAYLARVDHLSSRERPAVVELVEVPLRKQTPGQPETPPPSSSLPSPSPPPPPAKPAHSPGHTNMGLLTGIVLTMDGCSSIVGFLITFFLVDSNLTILLAVLTGLAFIGLVAFSLLRYIPPIPKEGESPGETKQEKARCDLKGILVPVFKLMVDPDMLLFQVPFIFYGCCYSFLAGSVPPLIKTASFAAPAMIVRGVAAMVSSVVLGRLGDKYGRIGTLMVTYIFALLALLFTLLGVLVADWLFFLAYIFFGCVESAQPTLIYALLEQLFQGKAEAYSCWGILRSLLCGAFFVMGDYISPLALGIVVAVLALLSEVTLFVMWIRSRSRRKASAPVSATKL
ncbi:hypothetical protein PAPYR_121 [Paratrimastix pyriformis]|uniref:UNC93-like protein MFSD11 n=1 Tax=Paratrimastix pyriformis TaxID=342808 RepID=A0ABQ8UWE5_9EUKA|nr:hypothetical protein PAPYR_121 [Paratrimastix pyriformis]